MRTRLAGALLLLTLSASPGIAGARQADPQNDQLARQDFERRVTAYVELHRRLEGPLPTLEVSNDLRDVHAAMAALAKEVRKARAGARQGDIFTPAVAAMIRTCIASCLPPEQMADILADADEHLPRVLPRLRVNDEWPHTVPFAYVPAQLIATLPPLPPELQYRIVGRALVLWDHHANLIVDFIPAAFPT